MSVTCEEFAEWAREFVDGRHGLSFVACRRSSWRECIVVFRNATTTLEVAWDYDVDARLGPTVDGKLPPTPVHADHGIRFPAHWLSAIVELRSPGRSVGAYAPSDAADVGRANLEAALRAVINALFEFASDFLEGDFRDFPLLDAAAWARADAWRAGEEV